MKLNLALQGGGAHGAFTWGVLDKLLEAGITPEAISGTSAGTMNAVLLAEGWRRDGADGAREMLDCFWQKLSLPEGLAHNESGEWWRRLTRHLSPYDLNPFDYNPLKQLLIELIDFEALRQASQIKLYIAATEVETGVLRLFRENELDVEHLLASACLPTLHKAVEIDGCHYWDGGFSGNPVVRPLVTDCKSNDLLCVLLQPLRRKDLPTRAEAISERMTELSFQTAFMRELAEINQRREHLLSRPWLVGQEESRWRKLRMHLIEPDDHLASLKSATKFDTRKRFLESLRELGRTQAELWFDQTKNQLGQTATWELKTLFRR